MIDERLCLESPIFPLIVTIALFVERQQDSGSVYIFPFTGEDMAVTGLRHNRGRRGIRGHSLLNRRPGACRHKDCGGEKDRNSKIS
jgi:hypothetical protein